MRYFLLFMLASCGDEPCYQLIEDVCTDERVSFTEEAIAKVESYCSLSQGHALNIKYTDDPPETAKCSGDWGCSPILGRFVEEKNTIEVWRDAPDLDAVLRHELIHSGLLFAGRDVDKTHIDPKLWDAVDRTGSCEGKMWGLEK